MLNKNKRALEVIEAAATLPVMLLILVALVNLGFAVYARQAVQNAAAYGARMGSVAQDCRACAAYSAASGAVAGSLVRNASVQILAPGGTVGSILRIRVTGEVPNLMGPLMALNGGGGGGPIVVSAEATFRAEGW
jgi:hypothetical protein